MKYKFLSLLVLCVAPFFLHAVDYKPFIDEGNAAYDADNYATAYDAYDKAVYMGCTDGIVHYRYAVSYRLAKGEDFISRLNYLRAYQSLKIQNPKHKYLSYAQQRLYSGKPVEDLRIAVELGEKDRVKALLAAKVDPNAYDPTGTTAYSAALRQNDKTMIDILEKAGGTVESFEAMLPENVILRLALPDTARAAYELAGSELGKIATQNEVKTFFEPILRDVIKMGRSKPNEAAIRFGEFLDLVGERKIVDSGAAFFLKVPKSEISGDIPSDAMGFLCSIKAVDAETLDSIEDWIDRILESGNYVKENDPDGDVVWTDNYTKIFVLRSGARISCCTEKSVLGESLAKLKKSRLRPASSADETTILTGRVDLGLLFNAGKTESAEGNAPFFDMFGVGEKTVLDVKAGIRERKVFINAETSGGTTSPTPTEKKRTYAEFDMVPSRATSLERTEIDGAALRGRLESIITGLGKDYRYDEFLSEFTRDTGIELWEGLLLKLGPTVMSFVLPDSGFSDGFFFLMKCDDISLLERISKETASLPAVSWRKIPYRDRIILQAQYRIGYNDGNDPFVSLMTIASGTSFVWLDGWIVAARVPNDLKEYLDWYSGKSRTTIRSQKEIIKRFDTIGDRPLFFSWNDPGRNAALVYDVARTFAPWLEGTMRQQSIEFDIANFPRASSWLPYFLQSSSSIEERMDGYALHIELGFPIGLMNYFSGYLVSEALLKSNASEALKELFGFLFSSSAGSAYGSQTGSSADKLNYRNGKPLIRVAADCTWPPMEFIDYDQRIVGFGIDMMNEIAAAGGFEIDIRNVAWDGIFAGLATGEYDAVCSSVTITDERRNVMDFSEAYINAGQLLVVRSDENNTTTLADLKGKSVGAQIGTTGAMEIEKAEGVILKYYDEIGLAYEDLVQGRIAGVVADMPIAAQFALESDSYRGKLKIVGAPFTEEYYGIAVKKGNKKVLDLLNKGLDTLKISGKLDELQQKWLR